MKSNVIKNLSGNDLIECNNNVVKIISNGWLFLHQKNSGQRQFEYFTGSVSLSNEVIDNFKSNIKYNADYCKNNGVKYIHVVFPAKPIVLKNMLLEAAVYVDSIFDSSMDPSNVIYPISQLNTIDCMEKYGTHYSAKGYFSVIL